MGKKLINAQVRLKYILLLYYILESRMSSEANRKGYREQSFSHE